MELIAGELKEFHKINLKKCILKLHLTICFNKFLIAIFH